LKNGVNLIKDGIGAAKDFIKGNKIEEEIENSFKEITGEEKLKVGSYLINDKSEIGKVKTLSEIEKEAEEPSPFDELIGYIEYGDKGKEILEEENVKEIEIEDRVFNQVEKGDIESLYKESGIEDIANANPVASEGVTVIEEGGELVEEAPEVIGGVGNEINIAKEELGELAGKIKDDFKGAGNAGVGKTGEGIPLEEVKPDVLKQIYPDDNGAYGYLPNEGTAYYNPKYDFTDVDWAKDMQNVRKDYLDASKQLEIDIERMNSEGVSKEDIAKHVVDTRNQQKVTARASMTAEERAGLEARNIKKYENPIGPDAQWLFNKYKKQLTKEGTYINDEQIWNIVIQKSMVKDDVINTLLGIIH
ncbi:hypothetical protein, partial [Clostridium sp.]|uniref:hypothetical protein n=1 Tax=Clostridium sp. TaxID=1506 RepID=UPI00262E84C0